MTKDCINDSNIRVPHSGQRTYKGGTETRLPRVRGRQTMSLFGPLTACLSASSADSNEFCGAGCYARTLSLTVPDVVLRTWKMSSARLPTRLLDSGKKIKDPSDPTGRGLGCYRGTGRASANSLRRRREMPARAPHAPDLPLRCGHGGATLPPGWRVQCHRVEDAGVRRRI
jgi:hypothetical protein